VTILERGKGSGITLKEEEGESEKDFYIIGWRGLAKRQGEEVVA